MTILRSFFRSASISQLIIVSSLFLMTAGNFAFFSNVLNVYPAAGKNLAFIASLYVVFTMATIFLLGLLCYRHTVKPVLITILLCSAFTAYFMDSYNVIIDQSMIQNVIHTDTAESMDLFSLKLVLYVIGIGIIPALWVYKTNIVYAGFKREVFAKLRVLGISLLIFVATILAFGSFYSSFIREHKSLRFYSNPSFYLYSAASYLGSFVKADSGILKALGDDAKIPDTDTHRELIIFVVGETARADRFSLNGYARKTNPLLEQEDIVNFPNFWSCGTSTAISVPCMFSALNQSDYSNDKARSTENVLDVLTHAGVNVLWIDNNSDSKGVALRVDYENYKTDEKNPVCDIECRDVGMLARLQDYIDSKPQGDIFIVLHQMGNHGPSYSKRYPGDFEKFKPACQTNQLESCTIEEITNAYDNAVLYTDYFLSRVIALLKSNDEHFESAMFYVSDHGESLGEGGIYLHGMPNLFAPDAQMHVPAIMWFGNQFDGVNVPALKAKSGNKYSHDNIFHTILGFMEVSTEVYDPAMDIIHSPS